MSVSTSRVVSMLTLLLGLLHHKDIAAGRVLKPEHQGMKSIVRRTDGDPHVLLRSSNGENLATSRVERQEDFHDIKADARKPEDSPPDSLNSSSKIDCNLPFVDIGGHCLVIDPLTSGTWADVRIHCQGLGGQMVKIDSDNLLYYIVQYIRGNGLSPRRYWTGGSDIEEEGKYVWLDGTEMKLGSPFWWYDYEQVQAPFDSTDYNCVAMEELYYQFYDDKCNLIFSTICEQVP